MNATQFELSGTKILVIDDTPLNLGVIIQFLREHGIEVIIARNGSQGLERAIQVQPNLILLDIMMPDMDGFEICRQLKANPISNNIPVIFMTALDAVKDKVQGFEVGGVDYITKPIEEQEVLARITTHLRLQHITNNLQQTNQALAKSFNRLQKTQNRLIETQKLVALNNLIAGLAYEIDTPTGIGLSMAAHLREEEKKITDVLYTNKIKPGLLKSFIQTVRESNQVILNNFEQIADRILLFKQLAINEHQPEAQTVVLQKYLTQIASTLQAELTNANLTLTVTGDETLEVMTHPLELAQIITNLVTNSREHAYPNGETGQLKLTFRQHNHYLYLDYEDDGCGIPSEIIDKIFDPFFTTTPHQKNIGLGLYQVYNLVTHHFQGHIHCQSSPESGTKFGLKLSLIPENEIDWHIVEDDLPQPPPFIKAYLFGPLTIHLNDIPLKVPKWGQIPAVLAYLILHPKQIHHRNYILGLLWPDMPEDQGRQNFNRALSEIRRLLPSFLITDNDTIQINTAVNLWTDVQTFTDILHPYIIEQQSIKDLQQIKRAIDLYQQDLLIDLEEIWFTAERMRLQEWYITVLQQLMVKEKQQGNYQGALDLAHKLDRIASLNENAQRDIIRLYLTMNNPQAALTHFKVFETTLRKELGITPSTEMLTLVQEVKSRFALKTNSDMLQTGDLSLKSKSILHQATPHSIDPPLLGRDKEYAHLLGYMTTLLGTQQDGGGVILLEGAIGLGKTKLLGTVAQEAIWRGATVLWGYVSSGNHAYALLIDTLSSGLNGPLVHYLQQNLAPIWLTVLATMFPQITVVSPPASQPNSYTEDQIRQLQREAFIQLLGVWVQQNPLILCLEDVHDAPLDMIDLLTVINQRLRYARLLMVITYRPGQAQANNSWTALKNLTNRVHYRPVRLQPLDETATYQLIEHILGPELGLVAFKKQLYQEIGGNPRFIIETLYHLYEAGFLYQNDLGEWLTTFNQKDWQDTISHTIEQTIKYRMANLPVKTRHVLEMVTLLKIVDNIAMLAQLTDLQPDLLQVLLTDLIKRHFLEKTDRGYQFRHTKIAQVVYQQISPALRQNWHRQIANRLTQYLTDDPPLSLIETLAYHTTQGELWDQAIDYTLQVANMAREQGAYQMALAHYNLAAQFLATWEFKDADYTSRLKFRVGLARSDLYWLHSDDDLYAADVKQMEKVLPLLNNPLCQIVVLTHKATLLSLNKNTILQGQEVATLALNLAMQQDLVERIARAALVLGKTYLIQQNGNQAIIHLQQALNAWHQLKSPTHYLLETCLNLQEAYAIALNKSGLQDITTQLVGLVENINHPLLKINVYQTLSQNAVLVTNRYADCVHYARLALEEAKQTQLYQKYPQLTYRLGYTLLVNTNFSEAETTLKEAAKLALDTDETITYQACQVTRGWLYWLIGQYHEVSLLDVGQITGSPPYYQWLLLQIYINLSQGDLVATQKDLQQIEAAVLSTNNLDLTFSFYLAKGHLAWQKKEGVQAQANYNQAVLIAEKDVYNPEKPALARSFLALTYYHAQEMQVAQTLSSQAVSQLTHLEGGYQTQLIFYHHWQIMQAVDEAETAQIALQTAYHYLQRQKNNLSDPAWQTIFLNQIPQHQAIIQAYQIQKQAPLSASRPTIFPHSHPQEAPETPLVKFPVTTKVVHLPKIDAPAGGKLAIDQQVEVAWTIETPEDQTISNPRGRRLIQLKRLLQEAQAQQAVPSLYDLANALGVTRRTIDRDMAALRKAGYNFATRGRRD